MAYVCALRDPPSRRRLQALEYLEDIVIPGTAVLDMKDEVEVAKRLRARTPPPRPARSR